MERYPDIRSRTLEWMTKLIDAVYKGKLSSDEQRGRAGQPPLPLLDHFFSHLTGVYGTRELVNQNMAQVMATLEEFRGVNNEEGSGVDRGEGEGRAYRVRGELTVAYPRAPFFRQPLMPQKSLQCTVPLPPPLLSPLPPHFSPFPPTLSPFPPKLLRSPPSPLQADPRLITFDKFLREQWGPRLLSVYLEGLRAVGQPARLPCCDFPPDYSATRGGPALLDVRKGL